MFSYLCYQIHLIEISFAVSATCLLWKKLFGDNVETSNMNYSHLLQQNQRTLFPSSKSIEKMVLALGIFLRKEKWQYILFQGSSDISQLAMWFNPPFIGSGERVLLHLKGKRQYFSQINYQITQLPILFKLSFRKGEIESIAFLTVNIHVSLPKSLLKIMYSNLTC